MSASPRLAAVRALGASRPRRRRPSSTRHATGRTAGAPGNARPERGPDTGPWWDVFVNVLRERKSRTSKARHIGIFLRSHKAVSSKQRSEYRLPGINYKAVVKKRKAENRNQETGYPRLVRWIQFNQYPRIDGAWGGTGRAGGTSLDCLSRTALSSDKMEKRLPARCGKA
jgi:hypothetical protein